MSLLLCLLLLQLPFYHTQDSQNESVLFEKIKRVVNSRIFTESYIFKSGRIVGIITPRIRRSETGQQQFHFNYSNNQPFNSLIIISPRPPEQLSRSSSCTIRQKEVLLIRRMHFRVFELSHNCTNDIDQIRIRRQRISPWKWPLLIIQYQLNGIRSLLHLMRNPDYRLVPSLPDLRRVKRSFSDPQTDDGLCRLHSLPVNLSELYHYQYTAGDIVDVGYCYGSCSGFRMTFHAKVRELVMKNEYYALYRNYLRQRQCLPHTYKSHKLLYIVKGDEHVCVEVKDLIVKSCYCR